jgi:hypothetical protein
MYSWGEYKLIQSLWKIVWRHLRKLTLELLYDPVIPYLGMYLKGMKSAYQRDIYMSMFIIALLTIATIRNQPINR